MGASVALAAASTSFAASKTRLHYQVQFEGVVDCGTFVDNFVDYYDVREIDEFDDEGNLVLATYHIEHHSDDTNSVTGLTLHEHGHYNEKDDYIAQTFTLSGSLEIMNRPGTGVVVADVGHIIFDFDGNLLFFAGNRNHSELIGGDQVLCDALA